MMKSKISVGKVEYVEPKISVGYMEPIRADRLRLDFAFQLPGVHSTKLECENPVVVAQESLDHARVCAQRVIDGLENFPHTEQAGDLIAMAYAILHYAGNPAEVDEERAERSEQRERAEHREYMRQDVKETP